MGIGKTNAGGGGAALNFDVKAYATKELLLAAAPKENTIGIISTTEMTGWIIDANQPENLTEGMVWISVGTSSTVEFNALKKNGLQVYPLTAKQYISGALVNVTAMSYQGEEWVEWIIYLYNSGNEFSDITGGWVATSVRAYSNNTAATPSVTRGEDNILIELTSTSGNNKSGSLRTAKKITLDNCNKLTLDFYTSGTDDGNVLLAIMSTDSPSYVYGNENAVAFVAGKVLSNTKLEIDLSAVTGEYYIFVALAVYNANTAKLNISKTFLEQIWGANK